MTELCWRAFEMLPIWGPAPDSCAVTYDVLLLNLLDAFIMSFVGFGCPPVEKTLVRPEDGPNKIEL